MRLDRRNRTVTLTIGGKFYDSLERAAKRMNTVEWCKGNTPLTVFSNFVWSCMGECIMPYSTLEGMYGFWFEFDGSIRFRDPRAGRCPLPMARPWTSARR